MHGTALKVDRGFGIEPKMDTTDVNAIPATLRPTSSDIFVFSCPGSSITTVGQSVGESVALKNLDTKSDF